METNYTILREKIFSASLVIEERIKSASLSERATLISINTKFLGLRKLFCELDSLFTEIEIQTEAASRSVPILDPDIREAIMDCVDFYQEQL